MPKNKILKIKNLNVEFPIFGGIFQKEVSAVHAVKNFDLDVEKGKTIGIVGESGSGKSTLGKAILNVLKLTAPDVRVNGEIMFKYKNKFLNILNQDTEKTLEIRPYIQMIFQDPFSSLNPRHTIKQIIGEGLEINRKDLSKEEKDDLIKKTLNEVNLDEAVLHRFPHEFSGGQRQRIAIARAIILNPEFILLDEPTSALDLSIQAQIIDLLRSLRRNHNLSYIFISHNLKVIRSLCHYTLVMKDGKVIEEGITKNVLDNPVNDYTKQLVQSAFEVIGE